AATFAVHPAFRCNGLPLVGISGFHILVFRHSFAIDKENIIISIVITSFPLPSFRTVFCRDEHNSFRRLISIYCNGRLVFQNRNRLNLRRLQFISSHIYRLYHTVYHNYRRPPSLFPPLTTIFGDFAVSATFVISPVPTIRIPVTFPSSESAGISDR